MTSDLRNCKLIIFGCGYLGSRIAAVAAQKGALVTALTRNRDQADELKRRGVERVIVADLKTHSWHQDAGGGYDFAVDCVSPGRDGLAGYQSAYVGGMQSIANWAGLHPVDAFVYTGSTGVYTEDNGGWVTEVSPVAGHSERARLLLDAEQRVPSAGPGWRRGYILRLAGLYGPGRHHLLDRIRAGETDVASEKDRPLNLIHRNDAAEAVIACLEASETPGTVFNVSDNEPTPRSVVTDWLQNQCEIQHLEIPQSL